jgi:hypothetical protein
VAADAVVHFDDGSERALSKAGDRAHGEFLIRGGEKDFVRVIPAIVRR